MVTAVMDNAYNYFLTTYGNSAVSRYDAHKRSELRTTYNNIVKINKESPLYKIKESGDVEKFVIDIKENARSLKNIIASLSTDDAGIESAFRKKVAVSTQPDIVDAVYVGNGRENDGSSKYTIEVNQLASPQTNLGNFLRDDTLDVLPGSYSFDLSTTVASYEFQFSVNQNDNNHKLLDKISRLINTANIGLNAELVSDERGRSALKIESRQTGMRDGEDYIFQIVPDGANLSKVAMDVLGIGRVDSRAQNASFILNGSERSSYSNKFTIDNTFELNLKGISEEGSPVSIGYKTSVDAVADNIQSLVDSYNQMLGTAQNYAHTQRDSVKLISDIGSVAKGFQTEFENIGLLVDRSGAISIDRTLLANAVGAENSNESFSILNQFKDALNAKAERASINPMNYVNKILVAYKNPGHNFVTPYITSIYSGMMLDTYC